VGKRGLAFLGLNIMRVQPSSRSFALCVEDGAMEDLEARKVYQILPDREAAREGYIRVVDESGEDYVYPSDLFVPVRLPAAVVRRFRGPVSVRVSGRPRDDSASPVSGSGLNLRGSVPLPRGNSLSDSALARKGGTGRGTGLCAGCSPSTRC